jgi:deoxyribose-phosphate aldolase
MTHAIVEAVKNLKIAMAKQPDKNKLASKIDHTLLRSDSSKKEIETLCAEAVANEFFAVCVPPYFVSAAKAFLKGSNVKIATVAGFPMGYSTIPAKVEDARRAIADGADEIDMVINIAAVKSGNWNHVKDDIQSLTTLCRLHAKVVKVILETSLLTDEEIEKLCVICIEERVDFVKTSTGFTGKDTTIETIKLLRSLLPVKISIKASGGIRNKETAEAMIAAGAGRIGTSSGVAIVS